jgi:hypothetical protein
MAGEKTPTTAHDTFEAPEILQGFSLPVAQLFE